MIGNASQTVAGAAGETCGSLDGVPALVMADGPAGLRLSQHYTKDGAGARALGSTLPAGMEELMGPLLRSVMGRGRKAPAGPVLDQYCTAIPIGACLTQAGPATLMTSYNLLNGVHTSERPDLLRTVLREEWGWGGLVMTDWVVSAMGGKGKYPLARSAPSLHAGNDLFMPGGPGDFKGALRALRGRDPAVSLTRADAEAGAAHVLDAIRVSGTPDLQTTEPPL